MKERVRRQDQERTALSPPRPSSGRSNRNETEGAAAPRGGLNNLGRVTTAEEDVKQQKREDMRKILAQQVEESQRKKKEAERKRKEEDEREVARLKRDEDDFKRQAVEAEALKKEKLRAFQQENERATAVIPTPKAKHHQSSNSRQPEPFQADVDGHRADLFGAPSSLGGPSNGPLSDLFSAPPAPHVPVSDLFSAPPAPPWEARV